MGVFHVFPGMIRHYLVRMKYIVSVIFFGILPIWVSWFYLYLKNATFSPWDLLTDGALFPFACTLAITSFLVHLKIFNLVQESERAWAYLMVTLITIICIIGYLTGFNVLPNHSFEVKMDRRQEFAAIIAAALAATYGFIVEARVGKLKPKP